MSAGAITLPWGDGEHTFSLPLGQLRELQDKTGIGPLPLLRRVMEGTWLVDDLRETIRLGLIGGGMAPTAALTLVARYVERRPWTESVPLAQAILAAALFAPIEEGSPGKAAGPEGASETTTAVSPSGAFSASAP